ncbi:MAG: hypothetical protein AAGF94_16990 [Pseudomonadota bacterium]
MPLIEGLKSFWHGQYSDAAEILHGARFVTYAFSGSHAQRDVIYWTITEAATRSGRAPMAKALANVQAGLKPHSPINGRFLKRVVEGRSRTVA